MYVRCKFNDNFLITFLEVYDERRKIFSMHTERSADVIIVEMPRKFKFIKELYDDDAVFDVYKYVWINRMNEYSDIKEFINDVIDEIKTYVKNCDELKIDGNKVECGWFSLLFKKKTIGNKEDVLSALDKFKL